MVNPLAEWLVSEFAFPYDTWFDDPPPVTPEAMAEAWANTDVQISAEQELWEMELHLGLVKMAKWRSANSETGKTNAPPS
jgi:hypothetical protein